MEDKVLLEKGDTLHLDLDLYISIGHDSKLEYDPEEFRLYIDECVRKFFKKGDK